MATAWQIYADNILASITYDGKVSDLCWPVKGENNVVLRNELFDEIYLNGNLFEPSYSTSGEVEPNSGELQPLFIATTEQLETKLVFKINNGILTKTYTFTNHDSKILELKLFTRVLLDFGSNFARDTIFYDPDLQGLVAYEDLTYLAIYADATPEQYACQSPDDFHGLGAAPDKNLQLTNNPVTTGKIDGCLGYKFMIAPGETAQISLTFQFADSLPGLQRKLRASLNSHKTQDRLGVKTLFTNVSNQASIIATALNLSESDKKKFQRLAQISLYSTLGAINTNGSIFAAVDSSYFKIGGVDDYSYLWPRDACLAYITLLQLDVDHQLKDTIKQGINFLTSCLGEFPYLLHRYRLHNATLASSWHAWVDEQGNSRTPLQLDQTAFLVILYQKYLSHYQERIPALESRLPAVLKYLNDQVQGELHAPSFDHWENHYGQFLSEQTALIAALTAGEEILAGAKVSATGLVEALRQGKEALTRGLSNKFINSDGIFGRGFLQEKVDHQKIINHVDASFHWLWYLGVLPAHDETLKLTVNASEKRLNVNGGYARYEGDHYLNSNLTQLPGNPWYIATLWFAQYYLVAGKNMAARSALEYVLNHMDSTGLLPEMADPNTGIALSVKPLIWSHVSVLNLFVANNNE